MNDKLLRAFIEAQGFEIETVLDYKEKKMEKVDAMRHNTVWGAPHTEYSLVSSNGCSLDIDEYELYTARLREPIVNYKVTKKDRGDLRDVLAVISLLDGANLTKHNRSGLDKAVGILNALIEGVNQ